MERKHGLEDDLACCCISSPRQASGLSGLLTYRKCGTRNHVWRWRRVVTAANPTEVIRLIGMFSSSRLESPPGANISRIKFFRRARLTIFAASDPHTNALERFLCRSAARTNIQCLASTNKTGGADHVARYFSFHEKDSGIAGTSVLSPSNSHRCRLNGTLPFSHTKSWYFCKEKALPCCSFAIVRPFRISILPI
jgi:hypothetical protein